MTTVCSLRSFPFSRLFSMVSSTFLKPSDFPHTFFPLWNFFWCPTVMVSNSRRSTIMVLFVIVNIKNLKITYMVILSPIFILTKMCFVSQYLKSWHSMTLFITWLEYLQYVTPRSLTPQPVAECRMSLLIWMAQYNLTQGSQTQKSRGPQKSPKPTTIFFKMW